MKIILAVVIAAGLFFAGWITSESMRDPGIEIIEKTKTITEYVNRPTTDAECWKCMENPLEIDGSIKNNILHAWASDGCRKSERDFILRSTAKRYKNVIQINYMYDFINQSHGGSILYFRKFGRVGVGGGFVGSERSGGLIGAIQYEF
jgi:hypothetical protein